MGRLAVTPGMYDKIRKVVFNATNKMPYYGHNVVIEILEAAQEGLMESAKKQKRETEGKARTHALADRIWEVIEEFDIQDEDWQPRDDD